MILYNCNGTSVFIVFWKTNIMFRFASFLVLATVSLLACTKSTPHDSIDGVWELRSASGMMLIKYQPGNGNELKFSGSTYELFVNGAFSKGGKYHLTKDASVSTEVCLVISDGQFQNRIELEGVSWPKTFVDVRNDTLRLVGGCFAYDAGSLRTYVRKYQTTR